MRNSPGVRRAPVHQFADGAAARAPRRTVEQALKHESTLTDLSAMAEGGDEHAPTITTTSGHQWPLVKSSETQDIALRSVTTEDVDQLWDWCREDPVGVTSFMGGSAPKNSRDLFTGIGKLTQLETQGHAWMRAITNGEHLAGFVCVSPIQRPQGQPPIGTVHLYIAMPERGNLSRIVAQMLDAFDQARMPMTLNVIVDRLEWANVLEPLGFKTMTVFTRPPITNE